MNQLIEQALGLPLAVYVAAGAVVLLGLLWVVLRAISRKRLYRRLSELSEGDRIDVSPTQLLKRSKIVESVARTTNSRVPRLTGIDKLWVDELRRTRSERAFRRVLDLAPDTGLFACFAVALERPKLAGELKKRLAAGEDFLTLRKIGLSGPGEPFDGAAGREFFVERLDEIREMTGDPEWPVRFFAVKIMLNDDDDRSVRGVWDALQDARALVRRTVIDEMNPREKRDRFFDALKSLFLDDPIYEVREAARNRMRKEFPERYHFDLEELTSVQGGHVLELLEPGRSEDENLAIEALLSDDMEKRLPAALYLQNVGTLPSHFGNATFNDRVALDRSTALLQNAASVGIADFLEDAAGKDKPASIYLALRVLRMAGPRRHMAPIAVTAFRKWDATPESRQLYEAALAAVRDRGDDDAVEVLAKELLSRREDEELAALILEYVPPRSADRVVPVLLQLLHSAEFQARRPLRAALTRFPIEQVLPVLIHLISAPRGTYPHSVRITALQAMGDFEKPYLLQLVLENLSILPTEEAKEFAATLAAYSGDLFDERVGMLLESTDASVRSAIIASLPATGKQDFLKQIRAGLNDADPEVRIASVWALVQFDDTRSITQAQDRLRDPVERVRVQTARALGAKGSDTVLKGFAGLLSDENEVDVVKQAAIIGLGESESVKAVDILFDELEERSDFDEEAIVALARKRSAASLKRMIELMKDASPQAREKISVALKRMGEDSEDAVTELLEQDIASLRPYIVEVLESIGFVEATIRKLSHRDPEVRRRSAEILSYISTVSAFRGIVLAARDPDQEVRVQVTRAIESLNSEGGKEILEKLKNDPEKRVRKYTMWALQRIESKSK
jgi:HEAT repeat protein